MPSGEGGRSGLALRFAYFSGLARLLEARRGGFGTILRLQRVRPSQHDRFQPLKANEITPEMLERLVRALRRWRFDVVSIDAAIGRIAEPPARRRFVCLTFDGAYRDVVTHAYPVLARHQVPFTVYVPTGVVDGIAPMWWLALQQVVANHDRISLVMDRNERHFDVAELADKHDLFGFLANWLRRLAPAELAHAIQDLCNRYTVDLVAISRAAAMDWTELGKLVADARVTIGTATVNYPALAAMTDAVALREMTMGRQVAEAALGRPLPHFAYPFGDLDSAGPREMRLAAEAGFASAVTAQTSVVWGGGRSHVLALPRISWDGRQPSLRALRVRLSGL